MNEGFLALEEILALPRQKGGVVRHSLRHENFIENVSLNNLLAAHSRLSTDIFGNKFPAQFVLPVEFWDRAMDCAREHSIIPEYTARDLHGGLMNIIGMCSLMRWDGGTILMYTPHNETVWDIEVGTTHELIRKPEALALLGPNKGFDLIVPYHPALGYAPPRMLLQWVEEGYESPKAVLEKIKLMAPEEQKALLAHWERIGFDDSVPLLLERGILAPETLVSLAEPGQ